LSRTDSTTHARPRLAVTPARPGRHEPDRVLGDVLDHVPQLGRLSGNPGEGRRHIHLHAPRGDVCLQRVDRLRGDGTQVHPPYGLRLRHDATIRSRSTIMFSVSLASRTMR
jgi:hypothetical protein